MSRAFVLGVQIPVHGPSSGRVPPPKPSRVAPLPALCCCAVVLLYREVPRYPRNPKDKPMPRPILPRSCSLRTHIALTLRFGTVGYNRNGFLSNTHKVPPLSLFPVSLIVISLSPNFRHRSRFHMRHCFFCCFLPHSYIHALQTTYQNFI